MANYEAIVYDLDGTLLRLTVDWDMAHRDVVTSLSGTDLAVDGESLWDLLDRAHAEGFADQVERVLSEHEREGARQSIQLPTAAELPRSEPVGVCSLNAESACNIALSRHNLDPHVEAVVGRDSVSRYKPDPEPLLAVLEALDVAPAQALFVGDTDRDKLTAERAGVDFRFVSHEQD